MSVILMNPFLRFQPLRLIRLSVFYRNAQAKRDAFAQ